MMPAKAPVHPWEKIRVPWVRFHIDFAGFFCRKMFKPLTIPSQNASNS